MKSLISPLKWIKRRIKNNLPRREDFIILLIGFGSFFTIRQVILTLDTTTVKELKNENWLVQFAYNLLCFSAILLPGKLIFIYIKKTKYLELEPPRFFSAIIKFCFIGKELTIKDSIIKFLEENANLNGRESEDRDLER